MCVRECTFFSSLSGNAFRAQGMPSRVPRVRRSVQKRHKKQSKGRHGGVRGHVGKYVFYYSKTLLLTFWRLQGEPRIQFFLTQAPGRHFGCLLYRHSAHSSRFRAPSNVPRRPQKHPKERTFDDRNSIPIPAPVPRGRGPPSCWLQWGPLPSNSPPLMGSFDGLKPRPSFR